MSTEERSIQILSIMVKMKPYVTIFYGWHPDTGEVVVSIKEGAVGEPGNPASLPESEWQTLDFTDESMVDALFSFAYSPLRDIQELIDKKDYPSEMATIQYVNWLTGQAI